MNRLKLFFSTYRLPILTGIFIGTSFIPFPPWASLFAFVPLWIFLREQDSAKKVFVGAWISSFVLTLIGFNWIAHTVREFGHMPWAVSVLTLLAFCGFANLDVPLASFVWLILKKRFQLEGFKSMAVLAVVTALFERHFPTIFTWNYGFPFYWARLPVSQLAEIIGFSGISTLVILTNLACLQIWDQRADRPRLWRRVATLAGVFILLNGAGWLLKQTLPAPDQVLRPLVVQGNIGNLEKHYAERGAGFRDYIVNKYLQLTRQALTGDSTTPSTLTQRGPLPADVVIWPETAFPVTVFAGAAYDPYVELLKYNARELQIPFIIGGYGQEEKTRKTTNSLYLVSRDGNIEWPPYSKSILLAFGEYLPLGDWFPKLKAALPVGDFARGPGPEVKTMKDPNIKTADNVLKYGPQICYEGLFPEFSKALADQGAQIIVNVTNDSWFGTWQEPNQHLFMTLARAIEFRRPVIRSTNTGISTVALADGTILERSPLHEEWTHIYEVPYRSAPSPTLYQQFPWLIDAVLIILLIVLSRGQFAGTAQSRLGRN